MIVNTKYRDIPWEEARKCFAGPKSSKLTAVQWDSHYRSKPVIINVPSVIVPELAGHSCAGPHFSDGDPRKAGYVCPHIAEIGD